MGKLKVFITYSHLDKELANKFINYLINLDFEIIWDENMLVIGDDFDKKLKRALYESDIYLPIISDNFERSNFATRELLIAIGYNSVRERPRVFSYIVCGNKIPVDLSKILCFMGTDNIDDDLKNMGIQLDKLRGSILANQDTNSELAENLKISLETYLTEVFTKLEKNEKKNKVFAYVSYITSALFLISILLFLILNSSNYKYYKVELFLIIFYSIKNIAILTVFAALSRFSFILGKSFMVESIRNGDRIHAISFGKFYIQAYGNEANRNEIREVLGEWNIDKGSSFQAQDAKEIDPNFLGTLELIKSYIKKQ